MSAKRPQRGFFSIGAIFWLLVFGGMVFLALRLLPPYISNYEFQSSIDSVALSATYTNMTDDDIMKAVIARASGYGIELQPKQVKAHKGEGVVSIETDYTVPVDLIVRQVDLHFEPSAKNQNMMK